MWALRYAGEKRDRSNYDSPPERATAVDIFSGIGFRVLDPYSGATATAAQALRPDQGDIHVRVREASQLERVRGCLES
jgi:hypothetical protein